MSILAQSQTALESNKQSAARRSLGLQVRLRLIATLRAHRAAALRLLHCERPLDKRWHASRPEHLQRAPLCSARMRHSCSRNSPFL